jgi:hypothetical protein
MRRDKNRSLKMVLNGKFQNRRAVGKSKTEGRITDARNMRMDEMRWG